MTDLKPAIPISELEYKSTSHRKTIIGYLTRASDFGFNFLRDHADPHKDMNRIEYVVMMEEAYSAELDMLRKESETGLAKVRLGWAEMRIHW